MIFGLATTREMSLADVCWLIELFVLLSLLIHVLVLRNRVNRDVPGLSLVLPLNVSDFSSRWSLDIGLEKVQQIIVGVLNLGLLTFENSFYILFDVVDYLNDKVSVFLPFNRVGLLLNDPPLVRTRREARQMLFLFLVTNVEEGLDVSLVDLILNDSVAIH